MQPQSMTLAPGIKSPFDRADVRRSLERLLGPMLMAITTAMCSSFKQQLMQALHNFSNPGSNFNMALFDSTASLDATTTAYATANEVTGTGYTAGGKNLTNGNVSLTTTTAFTTFTDLVWTASTFTARGAQIFNRDQANKSVAVFDFGANVSVTSGNLTVAFPTSNATAAVLRIA